MTARRSDGTEVEVDLPEAAKVVEGGVKVSTTGDRSSRLTFEAPDGTPGVALAFQALQLNYEGNVFHTWRPVDVAKKLRNPSASSEERDRVLSEPDVMEVPEAAVPELEDRRPEDVPAPAPARG